MRIKSDFVTLSTKSVSLRSLSATNW